MTLPLVEPLGSQRPRIVSVPEYVSSSGAEAVELCRMAGMTLDPWQEWVLAESLGEQANHKWSAFELGWVVARQNGKTELLVARILVGLFLLNERLIIYSAHLFDTAVETFRRLVFIIENTPELLRKVKLNRGKVGVYSHGSEGVELKTGQRIRFKARSSGAGRGFTCDCLMLDEAMILSEATMGAVLPTLSARPNPQVIYAGSAVDQNVHSDGVVLARIRERGLKGSDPSLAYFEFSADYEHPDAVTPAAMMDQEAWAQANPGLGIRITHEYIEREARSMDGRTFAVERLGVGDWPVTDGSLARVIKPEAWAACADPESSPLDPVCFAFDVTPDRSRSSISVAGKREDGRLHIETVQHLPGTSWVAERLSQLADKHRPGAVICDAAGPVASLLPELAQLGVQVTPVSAKEHAQACGQFYDAIADDALRHRDTPELTRAIDGAAKRPLGDAWVWSRRDSSVDISPLVAGTLALWGFLQAVNTAPQVWDLNEMVEQLRAEQEAKAKDQNDDAPAGNKERGFEGLLNPFQRF